MANEYYARGITKVLFLATAPASLTAPTLTALNAGVNLGATLGTIEGFEVKSNDIDVDALDSPDTYYIPGGRKLGQPSITFNSKKNPAAATGPSFDPIRASQVEGASGYMAIARTGAAIGETVDLWPCRVSSVVDKITMANENAKFMVTYSLTGSPTKNSVIA